MVDNQYDESSLSFFRVYEVDEAADDDARDNLTEGSINAEFYVSEIDRSDGDKVVWEAAVYGLNSNDCEKTGGANNTVLRFSTVNSIKQNDLTKASFRLEEQGEAGRAKVFRATSRRAALADDGGDPTLATSSLEGSLFS
ncbi:hypothetical protein JL721_11546 [Aureococcus anophagefferens]|nr:hypothetical protein JL721_11546 [Aureococcus anophagefferens]